MTDIRVKSVGGDEYEVTVSAAGERTTHRVRVTERDRLQYGPDATAERLLEESFRFLLEREPPSSILSRFDLPVIGKYFPEYAAEIRKRVG
jgi:hypothetical protein